MITERFSHKNLETILFYHKFLSYTSINLFLFVNNTFNFNFPLFIEIILCYNNENKKTI